MLANTAVLARAAGNAELAGMGTTLTAVTIAGPRQLLIGHVGDSRAYLVHDGDMRRLTDDHSLVEELVREGRLTPEQAEAHPQRAIVTRALGVSSDVDVDVYRVNVAEGDRLVLCSDGLTTMVRDRDVGRIAAAEADAQAAADALVAAANDAGGEDNITVVVLDVVAIDADAPMPAEPETPTAIVPTIAPIVTAPEEPRAEPQTPPKRTRERQRGSGWRSARSVLLVLIPILIVLGIAAAAIGVYARHSYYVGTANGNVVIFKGVPGGVLGWNPTVDERTDVAVADLTQLDQERVRTNSTRGSHTTTEAFVARLRDSVTTTSTTTTTVKKPKTKPKPKPKTTTTVKRPKTTTTVARP